MCGGDYLPKNRFVLALIKKIIEDNPDIDFETLKDYFKNIYSIPSVPIFMPLDEAKEHLEKTGRKDYFINDSKKEKESIEIRGYRYAVANGWTIKEMPEIIRIVDSLKYKWEEKKKSE